MKTLFIAVLLFSLSGCTSCRGLLNCDAKPTPGHGELFASADDLTAKDDQICRSYGAQPGTTAYVQCRALQDQRRDENRRPRSSRE